jgi:hypothetical protein
MKVNSRWQTPTFSLQDGEQVSRLIDDLTTAKVEFLCLDVFRRLHDADENDNSEMAEILTALTRIQNEAQVAIALVHHTSKSEGVIFRRIRGASAIHGWTEWAVGVSVVTPDDAPHPIRKLEFETKAAAAAPALYFVIDSDADSLRLNLADKPVAGAGAMAKFLRE